MITQTVSVIDLNIIDKISLINDNGTESYKGGLEIMGDFDEGKCFKLNLNDGHSYLICGSNGPMILGLIN